MSIQLDRRADEERVAPSVAALFGAEVRGEPLAHDDGKTGARLERVVVDGQSYVLKYLHLADDWGMRATGDVDCRAVRIWRHGWLDKLPACLDHAIVGAAWDDRPDGRGAVLVMRDVGPWLVPPGQWTLPLGQHLSFVDHMAQLHATSWGWRDTIGLLPLSTRLTFSRFPTLFLESGGVAGGGELVAQLAELGGDPLVGDALAGDVVGEQRGGVGDVVAVLPGGRVAVTEVESTEPGPGVDQPREESHCPQGGLV